MDILEKAKQITVIPYMGYFFPNERRKELIKEHIKWLKTKGDYNVD